MRSQTHVLVGLALLRDSMIVDLTAQQDPAVVIPPPLRSNSVEPCCHLDPIALVISVSFKIRVCN
jgi:hypothetical protein